MYSKHTFYFNTQMVQINMTMDVEITFKTLKLRAIQK